MYRSEESTCISCSGAVLSGSINEPPTGLLSIYNLYCANRIHYSRARRHPALSAAAARWLYASDLYSKVIRRTKSTLSRRLIASKLCALVIQKYCNIVDARNRVERLWARLSARVRNSQKADSSAEARTTVVLRGFRCHHTAPACSHLSIIHERASPITHSAYN